jgi:hypothetical protein
MYKVGDVVVCMNNDPNQDYIFDFVSYILKYHKINPLEKYKKYTIKEIHTYWDKTSNCYDVIDDTSSRYDHTSYILDEVEVIYGHTVFDMNRFITVKEYRIQKLQKLNDINEN